MIRRRPRKAATAAMLAVAAAAAAALGAVPVAAAASASSITIDSVTSPPGEPGLLSVHVEAPYEIDSLSVNIYSGTTLELHIPYSEFSLPSNLQDGSWTVQAPITEAQLPLGTYQVTVDARDTGGDSITGASAPGPWFFGHYPSVTIGASTTTLSYTQQSVTVAGQVTADSPTGVLEGVPDQQVSITGTDGGSWSATTDQDGNYSVTITPNLVNGTGLAGSFSASVSAGPAIEQASSPEFELTGDVDPAQVRVALNKSKVNFGTKVTFSGTAKYQSDGIWLPFADATIDVTGKDAYSGRSVPTIAAPTNGTGHFKVVLPARPTTTWTANPAPSQYLTPGNSELGSPNSATLSVVLPTRTTRLHVDYNPVGEVKASGCLGLGSAVASFRDLSSPALADLYLQYSRTTHGPWRTLGALGHRGAPACHGGTGFGGKVGSPALSGHYRVNFSGQALYQRSVSAPDYAATVPTRIINFRITPHAVSGHGRIHFTGQVQQKDRSWKLLGGARVTIYIKAAGSATWYWYRHAKTSSSGRFSISFADPVSGHWLVGYRGNSSHLLSLSRILYVRASGTAANVRHLIGAHSLSGSASRALQAAG